MKQLTQQQQCALNAMRQRGMWVTAQATEQAWQRGERYYLDSRVYQDSHLRGQMREGNDTAVTAVERS